MSEEGIDNKYSKTSYSTLLVFHNAPRLAHGDRNRPRPL